MTLTPDREGSDRFLEHLLADDQYEDILLNHLIEIERPDIPYGNKHTMEVKFPMKRWPAFKLFCRKIWRKILKKPVVITSYTVSTEYIIDPPQSGS